MKGTALACVAVCALISVSAPVAEASTSSPSASIRQAPRAPRANEIRFETRRRHLPGDEISLGGVYSAPSAEAAPAADAQPQIIVAPIFVPTAAEPAEAPSRGPHIIYIGEETPRQKSGIMPRVIYGDLPSRPATGPEILYGDVPR